MRSKSILLLLLGFLLTFNCLGQQKKESPYQTDLLSDGIWVTASVGLNVLGYNLIQNKDPLTIEKLNSLSKDDVWAIDRWAAGNYSEQANSDSYIPFYASFILPLALLLNDNERSNAGQISVLFVETMATTGALFSITAGLVQKSRPLVYNTSIPVEDRVNSDEQRSFYAGHTAATAAATFFAAKVFSDFNPDSPLKPYVWGVAVAIPVSVGYFRITSGKHFLTDNLIGYAVGAATGILIPEFHKRTKHNLQIYPVIGILKSEFNLDSSGMAMSYKF